MAKLQGTEKVLKNLNREVRKIRGGTARGMRAAGLLVKGRSMAKAPVDTSNLRNSHFVIVEKAGKNIQATIGATAFYAVFVHENLEANHVTGQAKFLESALAESQSIILALIARFAKI